MLRITASQVHADLTGVHPVAGNIEPKQHSSFPLGTVVKFSIPTYVLGTVSNDEGAGVQADGEQCWTGKHHETPLSFTMAAAHLRAMCKNILGQLDALEDNQMKMPRVIVGHRMKIISGDWNLSVEGDVTQIKLEYGRVFAKIDTGASNDWYDATCLSEIDSAAN